MPVASTVSIAAGSTEVDEGEDAVFTLTRTRPFGQARKVRVGISGHDKVMSEATRAMAFTEVGFARGASSAELRLTTEQDLRNEGDGDIRGTIVPSAEHSYAIGTPGEAVVRVRDDDVPEVTLHVLSPEGLTLESDTWTGEMPEGTKILFETRCTGTYTYSHPFLPLLDHAHDFNHPYLDYNHAGYWSAPCNRQREFPVSAGQSFTGPDGGEIRAFVVTNDEMASRWQGGVFAHDSGGRITYFTCLEHDYAYCPRYTVATPSKLRVAVYNLNPTVVLAAERDEVEEGEPARFVITRIWDHPGIFDHSGPGNSLANTRIGYRVTEEGGYVATGDIGEVQRDAFTFSVHEYVVEIPTTDDAVRREGGAVTLELLPDSFHEVNTGGQYELIESLPGVTPPGKSSIRASVAIRESDRAATLAMREEAVSVDETAGAVEIGVTRSGSVETEVLVDYATRTWSGDVDREEVAAATPGDDYTARSGTLTFAPGETSKSIAVVIIDDTMNEPPERFEVTLASAQSARVGQPSVTTVTILPDDREPEPEVWIEADRSDPVPESMGSIEFAVRLSAASGHVVRGTVYTSPGDQDSATMNVDYRSIERRTVEVEPGKMKQIIPVELIDDDAEEADIETFTIVLEDVAHARVRPQPGGDPDRSTAIGAIADDDDDGTSPDPVHRIEMKVRPSRVPESGLDGPLTVTAQLVGGTVDWDTTVRVAVDESIIDVDQMAIAPHDFAPIAPFDVVIPTGATAGSATFEFVPVDDALDEHDEFVTFRGEDISVGSLLRSGLPVSPGAIVLMDDDQRGVMVSRTSVAIDEGDPDGASYSVVLGSRPTAAVTVDVDLSGRRRVVSVTPATLLFDATNWHEPQTVAVRAVEDGDLVDDMVELSHLAAGGDYEGVQGPTVTVSVRDTTEASEPPERPEPELGDRIEDYDAVLIGIEDVRVREENGPATFRVSLSAPNERPVTVAYATGDGTAVAGADFAAATGTLTLTPGETERMVEVAILDDDHAEGEETFTVTLADAFGALLDDATATGTIVDGDVLQRAWLARFGRTVAQHVLGGVEERLTAPREPGVRGALAGHRVSAPGRGREAAYPDPLLARGPVPRLVTMPELLAGTALTVTEERVGGGGLAVWGRGVVSRFGGSAGDLILSGDVWSATLGADGATGALIGGLAVVHSRGQGAYRGAGAGTLAASVTGLYPYVGYRLSDRTTLWGVTGYGRGSLRLEPEGGTGMEADLSLIVGAGGTRGVLLSPATDGFQLALEADGLWVRVSSEGALRGLADTTAEVTRLRFGLQGSYPFALGGAGSLTPSAEVGLRHDGGDAETGLGADLGGGLVWLDGAGGVSTEVRARGLLLHRVSGFRDWRVSASLRYDPQPLSELGLSVAVTPSLGSGSGAGGVAALWGRQTLPDASERWVDRLDGGVDAEIAYGLPVAGGRFIGTPRLGFGYSSDRRLYRVDYDLALARQDRTAFDLGLEGRRRESADGSRAHHEVELGMSVRW